MRNDEAMAQQTHHGALHEKRVRKVVKSVGKGEAEGRNFVKVVVVGLSRRVGEKAEKKGGEKAMTLREVNERIGFIKQVLRELFDELEKETDNWQREVIEWEISEWSLELVGLLKQQQERLTFPETY